MPAAELEFSAGDVPPGASLPELSPHAANESAALAATERSDDPVMFASVHVLLIRDSFVEAVGVIGASGPLGHEAPFG